MIGYDEIDDLDDELYDAVAALHERADAIWSMPEDLGMVEAWEEFVADCDQLGYPDLAATGRFGQFQVFLSGSMASEALDAYARLMQLIHRHGDLIKPGKVEINLNAVDTAVSTFVDDPAIGLDRITRLIDLVEQTARSRGVDLSGIFLARAMAAEAAGDEAGAHAALDEMRAQGNDDYSANSLSIMPMEIAIIARFDPARAASELRRRLQAVGIDADHLDPDHPDAGSAAQLLALLAYLERRLGDDARAEAIADRLLEVFGAEALARGAVLEYLLAAVEHRPDAALVAADHALANLDLDESDWESLAAVARSRALAAPDGEEARLLRALASRAAAAHDRRGSTTVASGDLERFWWRGLAPATEPAALHDPAVWDDREERAEAILAAGWLDRVGAVNAEDCPIAIKYRYQEVLNDAMGLLSAETVDDADALASAVLGRAVQLHCATTRFAVPLLHGLRMAQLGDIDRLASDYHRAQIELIENSSAIVGPLVGVAASTFPTVVQMIVERPQVAWQRIEQILAAEARVREVTAGPRAHLVLAHAEVAAHLGRTDLLPAILIDLEECLRREGDDIDPAAIALEMIRLSAFDDPRPAAALADWVTQAGDAEQARSAAAWSCWFRTQDGDRGGAQQMKGLLAASGGDVAEFSLPSWAILEAISPLGDDLRPVIDSILAEYADDVVTDELSAYAACASALLHTAPDDPRGPRLREEASRMAAALDERNGSDRWTAHLRARWFPNDPSFGAA